jgi:peptidyl-tRNA hydrolase, PTH1 family
MKCIIGLGNPGTAYEQTRHNIGFLVVDAFANKHAIKLKNKRSCSSVTGEGQVGDARVLLVKPQTFMNASGQALNRILNKYPINAKDIVVVYDDADLHFGDVRTRAGGTSAGHRGMESILQQFPRGTGVARVRVGVGRPPHSDMPLEDFVLHSWTAREQEQIENVIEQAVKAIESYV